MRCYVDNSLKEYQIRVTDIDMSGAEINKGFVIEVTDPELLEITGGIIQGMSGSPILQDGKLIGAVTHVFVQDSTKGIWHIYREYAGRGRNACFVEFCVELVLQNLLDSAFSRGYNKQVAFSGRKVSKTVRREEDGAIECGHCR